MADPQLPVKPIRLWLEVGDRAVKRQTPPEALEYLWRN
jgi:hypothetical protein